MLAAVPGRPGDVLPAHGRAQWDPHRLVFTWPPSRDLDELEDETDAVFVPPGANVAEVLAHASARPVSVRRERPAERAPQTPASEPLAGSSVALDTSRRPVVSCPRVRA